MQTFFQQRKPWFEKKSSTFYPLNSPNKNVMAVRVEREKELCCMDNELIIGSHAKYHWVRDKKTELFSFSSWNMKKENPLI